MSQSSQESHEPVLLREAVSAMGLRPGCLVIDGTYGRGGHTQAILQEIGADGKVLAFDRDPQAVVHARNHLADEERFEIIQASFDQVGREADKRGRGGCVDAILLDLGISSPQIGCADRGFSLQHDGPLDMRFNPAQGISAAQWLGVATPEEITRVLRTYGEEPRSRDIAKAIVSRRAIRPIGRTLDLAELVARAVSLRRTGSIHPATKTFLAIRLYINDELEVLQRGIRAAFATLATGGRLVVISFHSLEDRIVKRYFRKQTKVDAVFGELPLTDAELQGMKRADPVCGPVHPSPAEVERNPRSRSAVLRAIVKRARA